jgi:bifunctional DNA-binding transcriptional regulator/antitoxin component of YhaV-PrlF toxin-antitoxin module
MTKIVDTSIVQDHHRITLTDYVRKKLKVDVGDMIVFLEDERGNIMIKKAELKAV